MKIGFLSTDFPYKNPFGAVVPEGGKYVIGGVGEVVYQLSIALSEKGHEIIIYTTSADKNTTIEDVNNVKIVRYGKNFKIAETEISLEFLKGCLDFKPDIVHLHFGSPPATLAALKYIKNYNLPFVVTHHLDPDWKHGSPIRRMLVYIYAKYYLDRVMAKSDIIIALSDEMAKMSEPLRRYRSKLSIIPNGINLEDFETSLNKNECRKKLEFHSDKKIILFFGNLIERKGPQILIKSFPHILMRFPNTHLVLAGSPTNYSKKLKKLCYDLNIGKDVTFSGSVDESEKVLYYTASDIFSLPSYSEAFPITVLEASACGLPLVVSNIKIFQAMIKNGKNGFLSKLGNEYDLAEKIIFLLENDEKRKIMGKNAKKKVQELTWNKIAGLHEKIYEELL